MRHLFWRRNHYNHKFPGINGSIPPSPTSLPANISDPCLSYPLSFHPPSKPKKLPAPFPWSPHRCKPVLSNGRSWFRIPLGSPVLSLDRLTLTTLCGQTQMVEKWQFPGGTVIWPTECSAEGIAPLPKVGQEPFSMPPNVNACEGVVLFYCCLGNKSPISLLTQWARAPFFNGCLQWWVSKITYVYIGLKL